MALPLLEYKPTTQNQRVPSFGTADINEDTPYIYRQENANSSSEMEELIWAAYRQVFNEQEILKFNRQIGLETQLKNRSITVKDFIRGLAKSERFYQLVVTPNNNYRLVEMALKRLLGRSPYNEEEKIAWSIVIASKGWGGFVDALLDSDEYQQAFGDYTVPYQRKRLTTDRPFSFTTRYGADYRDRAGIVRPGPGRYATDWYRKSNPNYDGIAILAVLLVFSAGLTFLFFLNWLGYQL
ncbi:phycobilisome rod-core linker polypeptide [Nostoc sp. MS1]|uniref:phycobilisome rod-core linker polypeptide n=1 Tax=Nostoc sp. MS1 TaxID=2764711 RepID=UPI001CC77E2F|nr:phycobilisome rod-core linker polypeptide [Nostoc sp. MS1]BCL37028.1 phycobilisome rod-core linker polypeptide CpcG4 [Nostoc sp. MS1]